MLSDQCIVCAGYCAAARIRCSAYCILQFETFIIHVCNHKTSVLDSSCKDFLFPFFLSTVIPFKSFPLWLVYCDLWKVACHGHRRKPTSQRSSLSCIKKPCSQSYILAAPGMTPSHRLGKADCLQKPRLILKISRCTDHVYNLVQICPLVTHGVGIGPTGKKAAKRRDLVGSTHHDHHGKRPDTRIVFSVIMFWDLAYGDTSVQSCLILLSLAPSCTSQ